MDRTKQLLAVLVGLTLVLTACSEDDDVPLRQGATTATTSGSGAEPASWTFGDQGADLGAWGRLEGTWSGFGPKVAVLGDASVHRTREELRAALAGRSVWIAAVVGEGFVDGRWSSYFGTDLLDAAAARMAADAPEVVVLSLGTNDALDPARPLEAVLAELAELIGRFPEDACTVAVEVNEQASKDGFDPAEAGAINRALREVADVTVAPDPATLGPDGTFPAAEGRLAWAARVAEAVAGCS